MLVGCRGKPAGKQTPHEPRTFQLRRAPARNYFFRRDKRCESQIKKNGDSWNSSLRNFDSLALELFALQFKHNSAYRKICEARKLTPQIVEHWTQTPTVPTAAFKELELTSLARGERTAVFHSSGTTEQIPSRHFHNAESLAVYEASLGKWFEENILRIQNLESKIQNY